MKVLVVDDSRSNRVFIEGILKNHDHEILLATNGLEALIQIAQFMPDVILLDVLMPEMDGYETCRFIANNPDTKHIPVIILSGLDRIDDLVQAFDAGAMDFIRKPPNGVELIARVHSAMRIKRYQDKLKEMIIKDGMTGLYTHSYFLSVFEREFYSVKRYEGDLGLILLDIDNFKTINDTYGHIAGDKALSVLSSILLEHIRNTDVAARYGGEEFALIAPHTDMEAALEVAERLRIIIEHTSIVEKDHQFSVTMSAGVTLVAPKDRDCNDTIRRADDALYEAKKTGKNRTVARI
jgi:diguanylate cyclase (GGDEF)-like protein